MKLNTSSSLGSLELRNSMKRRYKIYKKYIKAKNSDIKDEYEKQYKSLREIKL